MASTSIAVEDVKVKDAAGEKAATNAPMVPLTQLFRFYGPAEKAMLAVGILFCMIGGVSFPCINIAFGELLDSTASMSNIEETTRNAVLFMVGVALVLGVSLFLGLGLVSWAATRGASNVRRAYMQSMMVQDVAFFDAAKAGELSAATSEKVQILQNGTAKKLGELVQATFTGVGGLGVGFYFSWELSLVIMAGVPLLAGALYFLVKATTQLTAANPEYEKAGAVATESLNACRVTSALNAQGPGRGAVRVTPRRRGESGDQEPVEHLVRQRRSVRSHVHHVRRRFALWRLSNLKLHGECDEQVPAPRGTSRPARRHLGPTREHLRRVVLRGEERRCVRGRCAAYVRVCPGLLNHGN
jgi:ATP-binding cassette subfamily B (MDR/TAP) protein 1